MRLELLEHDALAGPESMWPAFHLYGMILASDYRFASLLLPAERAAPDLTFTCVQSPRPGADDLLARLTPTYASVSRNEHMESLGYLYRRSDHDILRMTGAFDFYLWANRIVCHLFDPQYAAGVESWLLGMVLAYWLERQGILTLHAAAVSVEGQALAFLGPNGGGKSSLAIALLQAGYQLLTDDILPLEPDGGRFLARPGYPELRLWPHQAAYFFPALQGRLPAHPVSGKVRVPLSSIGQIIFCRHAQPLARIYLPQRCDLAGKPTVELVPLAPSEALIELVRHSFAPHVVAAAGFQAERFRLFSRLVQQVPVLWLRYSDGLGQLPRVREAIREDLERGGPAGPEGSWR
jgi:hypothetical protein